MCRLVDCQVQGDDMSWSPADVRLEKQRLNCSSNQRPSDDDARMLSTCTPAAAVAAAAAVAVAVAAVAAVATTVEAAAAEAMLQEAERIKTPLQA